MLKTLQRTTPEFFDDSKDKWNEWVQKFRPWLDVMRPGFTKILERYERLDDSCLNSILLTDDLDGNNEVEASTILYTLLTNISRDLHYSEF